MFDLLALVIFDPLLKFGCIAMYSLSTNFKKLNFYQVRFYQYLAKLMSDLFTIAFLINCPSLGE